MLQNLQKRSCKREQKSYNMVTESDERFLRLKSFFFFVE